MKFGEKTFTELLGEVDAFQDGELIFDEGTAGGWVYVVVFGEVEIYKVIGGKKIILDHVHEGEVLGEMSFFDQRTRSAAARAVGKVGITKFKEEFLKEEYDKLPNCYKVILEALVTRMRSIIKKLTLLANNPEVLKLLITESAAKKQKKQ